ncbi:hypothetical protein GJAV_G00111870 [Gymnothorax javanicus]|nr:hypothetical protein GJAV_G00111870 [Gymnothorax javanicus]
MAEFSIDQNNLPGVKEVCRDFAVLEDHSLAYTLQEQEIESHLANNIHKSRLIQTDLKVAKRIQQEEDAQAKALAEKQQRIIEQSDTEIAQVFQDHLVRQAKQQRQQEEKDAEMARKLQKQIIKEERKMSKKLKKLQGNSAEPYAFPSPTGSPRGSRHGSPEPSRTGYPQRLGRGGHSRDTSPAEPHLSRSEFYLSGEQLRAAERGGSKKERPARPPPPQFRGRVEGREGEREGGKFIGTDQREDAGLSRVRPEVETAELVDLRDIDSLKLGSTEWSQGRGGTRELQEEVYKTSSLMREGRNPFLPPGEPDWMARSDYGVQEVTQGVDQMDLQQQEVRDMEVARRLQEEELKVREASLADTRAAQMAQDEEIAWQLMEEERKACKSSKKWGKKKPDAEWKGGSAGAVNPRPEDCQRQKSQKPARPPPPMHSYENLESSSSYAPTRPQPTYRGSLDKH